MKSWKDFCTGTQSSNPWNLVYRYVAGKVRGVLTLSTLEANNNTHTADIQSTLDELMDHFIPENSASSKGAHHKRVRQLMREPMHTTDDIPLTQREVQAALEKFDSRNVPGENALTSKILIRVSRSFPSFLQNYTKNVYAEVTFHNSVIGQYYTR